MHFESGNFYHIYNRGINRQKIFFSRANYCLFISKINRYIKPHCSIVSWCLMPNHFHILIYADERCEAEVENNSLLAKNIISEGLRMLLSSYSKSINVQEERVGNLFQQKTKSKLLATEYSVLSTTYLETCFHYIHFNPIKAGLVFESNDWEYSSYNQYFSTSEFNICDIEFGKKLIDLASFEKIHLPYLKSI